MPIGVPKEWMCCGDWGQLKTDMGRVHKIVLKYESEYHDYLWVRVRVRVLHLLKLFEYESEFIHRYLSMSTSTTFNRIKKPLLYLCRLVQTDKVHNKGNANITL